MPFGPARLPSSGTLSPTPAQKGVLGLPICSDLLRSLSRLPPLPRPLTPSSMLSPALARVPPARAQHPLLALVLLPGPATVSVVFPHKRSLLYLDALDSLGGSANKRHLSSQNTSHQVPIPQASEALPTQGAHLELSS